MKVARTSSTLGIVRSRSRSWRDFKISPFTTVQTVKSYISALAYVRKLGLSMSVNQTKRFLISSRMNNLTNCKRRFNADIMTLYFSAMDQARKLKFSSYVHLPSINKIFRYRYT